MSLKSIPPQIAKLQTLKELDISYSPNTLIPDDIYDLTNLEILKLSGTISTLSPNVANLKRLKELYINDNKDLDRIPSTIGSLQRLVILDVRNTKINYIPKL